MKLSRYIRRAAAGMDSTPDGKEGWHAPQRQRVRPTDSPSLMPDPSPKRKFGLKLMGRAVTRSAMEDPPLRAPLRGGGLFDA